MNGSKYLKLHEEAIKRDYADIWEKYSATHTITARVGLRVDLRKLEANQSVVYGDGKTFHFLLTKITP